MIRWWIIFLAVAGFAYVAGNECDSENARACYEDLVNYETIVFPFYGGNEAKLDDTCGNMNMSFKCIQSYVDTCIKRDTCDENCNKLLRDIHNFLKITGLIKLYDNLCDKGNAVRQTYLENIECLESTADQYAACHNISQESQHYMHTTEGANTVEASCCYLSWYSDCFTNATRDNCGENATIIVSIAVHYLLGDIAKQLCSNDPIFCDKPPLPPLPPPETTSDDDIDTNDITDNELEKNKHDKTNNDLDNDIDTNSATTLHTSIMLVLPCIMSILFKCLMLL